MNRIICCLIVLLPLVSTAYVPFDDSLITDRNRGSLEKPNLYDRNQQRLRNEGRYQNPGSNTSNYYYQRGGDSDSYYYQTPKPSQWDERSIPNYDR